METGRKDDGGKTRMELLPLDALEEVARVLTHGAKKYAPGNWQKVTGARERYTGALLRHLAAWRGGETLDAESGDDMLLHIAQVATNALFLVWFEKHGEPAMLPLASISTDPDVPGYNEQGEQRGKENMDGQG
jgi:hypothetical protein